MTVYDMIDQRQRDILNVSGELYKEKASKVAASFKGKWGGHTQEDIDALAYLKALTPEQIVEVASVLQAVDYLVDEARKDPVLAREIVEASTDEGYRRLMIEKGFDYNDDSIGALRAVDPYCMANSFLSTRKGLSLGSSIHNIGIEWKYGTA